MSGTVYVVVNVWECNIQQGMVWIGTSGRGNGGRIQAWLHEEELDAAVGSGGSGSARATCCVEWGSSVCGKHDWSTEQSSVHGVANRRGQAGVAAEAWKRTLPELSANGGAEDARDAPSDAAVGKSSPSRCFLESRPSGTAWKAAWIRRHGAWLDGLCSAVARRPQSWQPRGDTLPPVARQSTRQGKGRDWHTENLVASGWTAIFCIGRIRMGASGPGGIGAGLEMKSV